MSRNSYRGWSSMRGGGAVCAHAVLFVSHERWWNCAWVLYAWNWSHKLMNVLMHGVWSWFYCMHGLVRGGGTNVGMCSHMSLGVVSQKRSMVEQCGYVFVLYGTAYMRVSWEVVEQCVHSYYSHKRAFHQFLVYTLFSCNSHMRPVPYTAWTHTHILAVPPPHMWLPLISFIQHKHIRMYP